MKLHSTLLRATALAALLAAGAAQAQLKMPAQSPAQAPSAAPGPQGGAPQQQQPNMPDPLTKDFRACIQKVQDAAQQTKSADPVAAQACFSAETRRQEGKIGGSGTKMGKTLTPAEKKRFDEAGSAWRRYRDTECAFFADPKGTPPEAANYAQCILDRTIKRAIDMEGLALAITERGTAPPPPGAAAPAPAAPAPAAPAAPAK